MKWNYSTCILFNSLIVLAILSFIFVPLETFVNSTLLISQIIIKEYHVPSYIKGGWWFAHANSLKNYPGSMLLLSMFSLITGIEPLQIINIPILLPIAVILVYLLSRIFAPNRATFIFTYLGFTIFYIIDTLNLYTISYHSLGYVYYLIFLLLLLFSTQKVANIKNDVVLFVLISVASTLTYYFTSTLILITSLIALAICAFLHHISHEELSRSQSSNEVLYLGLLMAFLVVIAGEIIYSRIISSVELRSFKLSDLFDVPFLLLERTRVKSFERVIYINDLAKSIYLNSRSIILGILSPIYIYYINGVVALLSVVVLLIDLLSVRKKHSKKVDISLILYVTVFGGAFIHAMIYYVTYGAFGGRAYTFFVLPLSPVIYMHVINDRVLIRLKRYKTKLKTALVLIYIIFATISFVDKTNETVFAGFIRGYTRSCNLKAIETLPEGIILSKILDQNLVVLTDYPRSQYIFRGFILYNTTGDVRPYHEKLKILIDALNTTTSSHTTLYDLLGAHALLIASDNFERLVYGDASAYIAPPFNHTAISLLMDFSNRVYSSRSLTLLVRPH